MTHLYLPWFCFLLNIIGSDVWVLGCSTGLIIHSTQFIRDNRRKFKIFFEGFELTTFETELKPTTLPLALNNFYKKGTGYGQVVMELLLDRYFRAGY